MENKLLSSHSDSPHGVIKHHHIEKNENMMNTQEAIIKVSSHLFRRKYANDDDACKHCTSGKANRGEKNQSKNILNILIFK